MFGSWETTGNYRDVSAFRADSLIEFDHLFAVPRLVQCDDVADFRTWEYINAGRRVAFKRLMGLGAVERDGGNEPFYYLFRSTC